MKISFTHWLIETLIKETVQFFGGSKRGWKEFPNVERIDNWWWGWLSKRLAKDPGSWLPRIIVDGQEWSRDQVIDHIRQMTGEAPKPFKRAARPVEKPVQPVGKTEGSWILAKARMDEEIPDHNNVPHKLKKDQHVVLKNNNDGTWTYATVWKGKLQWHNAHMPQTELAARFERATDEAGNLIRGDKPSKLAKDTHKEEKKKFELTEEQREIAERFKEIKGGKDSDHIVINALAGTGKTTMLQHLAEKYGKRGEKWLYLVFGRRNREEAVEKFPDFVDVYTTNSYAGQVLENNKVKPTDRFAEYSKKGSKITEILDGSQYQQMVANLNVPHFDSPKMSKYIRGYMRGIWREFNREVEKLAGLAKAYNLTPESAAEGIKQIAKEHDINRDLERTKERLEKDPNSDFLNEGISDFMEISDFLSEDFLDRQIKAATWLLEKSMPHGIDQEYLQTHEKERKFGRTTWTKLGEPISRNLSTLRDFDDDLWYAAMHADELDWSRPKKYKYVLVDEVQDFNKAQKVLLRKLIENGARVVAVGDKNQSMYKFRGADAAAFKDITNMLMSASSKPGETEKTLTKNFRSKPGIIEHSNKNTIVSNLQAGRELDPHDPAHISDRKIRYEETMSRLGKEMESLGEMKKQTAFIARTNAPLAKSAMDLLKHKIPFVIYGKDMANEVINVINRVLNWQKYRVVNDDSDLQSFKDELDDFVEEKREKWGGSSAKAGHLKDLIEAQEALRASIDVVQNEMKEPNVDEFKNWLYKRLGGVPEYMTKRQKAELKKQLEEENPVTLTTAHRSKGLEFDRVFELTPSLYPHPRTRLDADFVQEENSKYVAGTRAKDEYHVVDDSKEE